MAMPYLEGSQQPERFLRSLVRAVSTHPQGLTRTVFELQTRDWRDQQAVPATQTAAWIRLLELSGARQIGYYPDDLHADVPELRRLVPAFSLRSTPEP